jgi:Protein of unknown function (DUF3617)
MRHPMACLIVSAIAVVAVGPVASLDVPSRKAGLWEMKMVFEGRNTPAHVSHHCVDAETDKLMSSFGNASTKDMCSKMDTQKVGDTYVVDSVCKMGPSTNTSHAVISGDFNSAYTVKMSSATQGGPNLPGTRPDQKTEMTVEARWTGACKPDQKPGDIIMSNGVKMNIRDLQKTQTFAPKQ